jgi:UDP-N-acetylglucosamine acyltransferase
MSISPQAVIDPTASIADDVSIGPWVQVGADVTIGKGCQIESHVVIHARTVLGKNNRVAAFSVLGGKPQHLSATSQNGRLLIGDHNQIHEHCVIHRGTDVSETSTTSIGDHNCLMNHSHVAHDASIGNYVTMFSSAAIAGHVTLHDYSMIGVFCGVHQHCVVGAYSFLSRAALVSQDVLPYLLVVYNQPKIFGLNQVGLRRKGFSSADIQLIKKAYQLILHQRLPKKELISKLQVFSHPLLQPTIDMLAQSNRGVLLNHISHKRSVEVEV